MISPAGSFMVPNELRDDPSRDPDDDDLAVDRRARLLFSFSEENSEDLVGDSDSRRGTGLDDDDLTSVFNDGAGETVLACFTGG